MVEPRASDAILRARGVSGQAAGRAPRRAARGAERDGSPVAVRADRRLAASACALYPALSSRRGTPASRRPRLGPIGMPARRAASMPSSPSSITRHSRGRHTQARRRSASRISGSGLPRSTSSPVTIAAEQAVQTRSGAATPRPPRGGRRTRRRTGARSAMARANSTTGSIAVTCGRAARKVARCSSTTSAGSSVVLNCRFNADTVSTERHARATHEQLPVELETSPVVLQRRAPGVEMQGHRLDQRAVAVKDVSRILARRRHEPHAAGIEHGGVHDSSRAPGTQHLRRSPSYWKVGRNTHYHCVSDRLRAAAAGKASACSVRDALSHLRASRSRSTLRFGMQARSLHPPACGSPAIGIGKVRSGWMPDPHVLGRLVTRRVLPESARRPPRRLAFPAPKVTAQTRATR